MRKCSFAQESQRYCNYSTDKFKEEITFIKNPDIENSNSAGSVDYHNTLETTENTYFQLIRDGFKPQQAREVLPNATKTEIIMTGFLKDWKHFFRLRTAPSAHPMMRELIIPLEEEFKSKNLI